MIFIHPCAHRVPVYFGECIAGPCLLWGMRYFISQCLIDGTQQMVYMYPPQYRAMPPLCWHSKWSCLYNGGQGTASETTVSYNVDSLSLISTGRDDDQFGTTSDLLCVNPSSTGNPRPGLTILAHGNEAKRKITKGLEHGHHHNHYFTLPLLSTVNFQVLLSL